MGIDPAYAAVARLSLDRRLAGDMELFSTPTFDSLFPSDCWVFGDCLEQLRDPWRMVRNIRERIDADQAAEVGPNFQYLFKVVPAREPESFSPAPLFMRLDRRVIGHDEAHSS